MKYYSKVWMFSISQNLSWTFLKRTRIWKLWQSWTEKIHTNNIRWNCATYLSGYRYDIDIYQTSNDYNSSCGPFLHEKLSTWFLHQFCRQWILRSTITCIPGNANASKDYTTLRINRRSSACRAEPAIPRGGIRNPYKAVINW